jgi:hypothetical protein
MKAIWSWTALTALALGLPVSAAAPAAEVPKSFEVPYRLTIPKHVLVRAKINGKGPFNFILDTGAPALFIATAAGKKAGLRPDRNGWATVNRFEVEGGVVLAKMRARVETPFQLEGMNGMGLAGAEVHGLIGYDILARYRMTIDFTRDKLIWVPLTHKPAPFLGMGRKSGGQGGLEVFGSILKVLGRFLGRKATPDVELRGFLGVTLVQGDEYPVVKAVLERGPAGRAGLKAGDQLSRVAGRGVYTPEDVFKRALQLRPGASVELTVLRGKETKRITVKVGEGI